MTVLRPAPDQALPGDEPVGEHVRAAQEPAFDWCVGCGVRPADEGGVVCEPCFFSEPPDFTVVVVYGATHLLQHRRAS